MKKVMRHLKKYWWVYLLLAIGIKVYVDKRKADWGGADGNPDTAQ